MAHILSSRSPVLLTLLICVTVSATAAQAQHATFVQAAFPTLNATSRHAAFPVRPHRVSIRYAGIRTGATSASGRFDAMESVTYTVIGAEGIRFETRAGLFDFFAEEPNGTYTLISGATRTQYKHRADGAEWSANLKSVIDSSR